MEEKAGVRVPRDRKGGRDRGIRDMQGPAESLSLPVLEIIGIKCFP